MKNLQIATLAGALSFSHADAQGILKPLQEITIDRVIGSLDFSNGIPRSVVIERYFVLLDNTLLKAKPAMMEQMSYRYALNILYFTNGKDKFPAILSLKDRVENRFATRTLEKETDSLELAVNEIMKKIAIQ